MLYRFENGLYSAVKDAGFRMDGYFVWCGSCIQGEDGRYYLFASRWKTKYGFPSGYMSASEIVLAVTDTLEKPFAFVKVIFSRRESGFWDSQMAHNPQIMKCGDTYVLFYIGTSDGTPEKRKIGVAYSHSITDGWVRPDRPLNLPENANNPAAAFGADGCLYLAFRDGQLRVSIAKSERFDRPFSVIATDIFPLGPIEDMYLFRNGNTLEIIAEDNRGVYTGSIGAGVHFCSQDGIHWKPCAPMQVYDRTVTYTDGTSLTLQRRERPQMLVTAEHRLFLFTTAKTGGETRESGGITWNMVQEFKT